MPRCFISRKTVFMKSNRISRLWIEDPKNDVRKTLEAIGIIPSIKYKDRS